MKNFSCKQVGESGKANVRVSSDFHFFIRAESDRTHVIPENKGTNVSFFNLRKKAPDQEAVSKVA